MLPGDVRSLIPLQGGIIVSCGARSSIHNRPSGKSIADSRIKHLDTHLWPLEIRVNIITYCIITLDHVGLFR